MLKKTGVKNAVITRLEIIQMIFAVAIRLPIVILWNVLKHLPKLHNPRGFIRAVGLPITRDLLGGLNAKQIQTILPSSTVFYKWWAWVRGEEVCVEELVDDTVLLWVGKKRRDRVVLYAHGGAYIVPLLHQCLNFAKFMQQSLNKRGHDVGFAVLAYSLVPSVGLEEQITQTARGVEHILASGVKPENLYLMGDSAGAQLMLAFLSHLLHPLNNSRRLSLPSRLGGVYLMSPWPAFTLDTPSMKENAHKDLLCPRVMPLWIKAVSEQFTTMPAINPFTSPVHAPEGWFVGMEDLVHRVFITGGTDEIYRDSIVILGDKLKKEMNMKKKKKNARRDSDRVTVVMQPGGVHNDPEVDLLFLLNPKRNSLTLLVVQWFVEGFEGRSL